MSHITIPYGPYENGILEPIPRGLEKVNSKVERDRIVVVCSILVGSGYKYFEIESGYANGKKSWIVCAFGGNLILDTQDLKDLQTSLQYLDHTHVGPISTSQQSKFYFQGKKLNGCLKVYVQNLSSSSSSSSLSSPSAIEFIKDHSSDEGSEDETPSEKRYHQLLHQTKGGISKSIFNKPKKVKSKQLILDETKASVLGSRGFVTKLWERYVLGIDDQEVESAVTEAFSSVRE